MQWAWVALGGLAAAAVSWSLAVVVYRAAPRRATSRRMAFLLFLEGVAAGSGLGALYLSESFPAAKAWQALAWFARMAIPTTYLLFLATLRSPLVRTLGTRPATVALWTLTATVPWLVVLQPPWFIGDVVAPWYAPLDFETGPASNWVLGLGMLGVAAFGLVVAVSTVRHARTPAARRTARAYLLAFGLRDVMYVGLVVSLLLYLPGGPLDGRAAEGPYLLWIVLNQATVLLFVPLLAYGILRQNLFDLDLRLKRGLARGLLATMIVGAVLVAGQVAENATNDAFGLVGGALAAAAALLLIRPLERLANKVADTAMPSVRSTDEYMRLRKADVYQAAVEGALEDGAVSARERAMLVRLQLELGIANANARSLEADVVARVRGRHRGATGARARFLP